MLSTLRRFAPVLILLPGLLVPAQAEQADDAEPELTPLQLVFVVTDPDFEAEDGVDRRLADHRNDRTKTASDFYVRNLVEAKVALLAGPLPDHERIRQVAVLDVPTREDAARVFAHSPAIESGRMKLEIYTWWADRSVFRRPRNPDNLRTATLCLLERSADAPSFTSERLETLQAAHLEYLDVMTESGDLVLAGPIDAGGHLGGVLVFRLRNHERVTELVAADPAVEAGGLVFELHRWRVPKESWQRRPSVGVTGAVPATAQ